MNSQSDKNMYPRGYIRTTYHAELSKRNKTKTDTSFLKSHKNILNGIQRQTMIEMRRNEKTKADEEQRQKEQETKAWREEQRKQVQMQKQPPTRPFILLSPKFPRRKEQNK